MMDLREAKACLDEYRISLATTCEMLKPNVAEGELGEAIGKLNDSLIAMLNTHVKEALVLSIMIWRQMNAIHEQMVDFPDEWADLLVALNQLKLTTDKAAEARAEYLRKAAEKETEIANPVVEAIREFRRTHAHLFTADRTDRARNVGLKPTDDQRRVPGTEISPVDQTTEETDTGTEKPARRLVWTPYRGQ